MIRRFAIALFVIASLARASIASADDGTRIAVTQLDVSHFPEVRIVASVTDAQGRPVKGLTTADLTVTEGGLPQQASIELASQSAPVGVALVLDTSGSMVGRPLTDAKAAMVSLIQALGPADRAAVITFDANVRISRPLTADKPSLVAATNGAVASGNTAIYDAMAAAITELDREPQARRAIVLLTDGLDTSSRQSAASVLASLAASRIPAYVIGLGADLDRPTLTRLATATAGGAFIEAPTSGQLAAIYEGLSEQLLTQYSVTYRSTAHAIDGATLSAELALRRAGTTIATTPITFEVPAGRGEPAPQPTVAPTARPVATAEPQPTVVPRTPVHMPPELIGLLGAAAILTLLLWVSEIVSRFPSRQRRRLEVFVRALSLTPSHDKRRSLVQRVLVPSLRSAGRPLLRITPAGMISSTRARLQAAGEPIGLGPSEFLGVRAGLGMVGAIGGLAAFIAVTGDAASAPLGAIAGALVGYVVPAIVVDRMANTRKAAIRRALPASLDMLALSTEAGLSFDGAIGQVAHRWNTPLSEELRRVLVEFQMGRDRKQALRELGERTGVPELIRFSSAVIQADSLGVPLSRVLHDQSAEIRQRRRQRAEESARTAPVKMLFPMVALIFPALFVVILGPAIPRLLEALQAFN
jgi:tight adherence protein C